VAKSRIVTVGGGFAGLAAAKALRKTPATVILIDRTNHHVFQPLLYQVAICVLTPNQIATPMRSSLRNQKNTTVLFGESLEWTKFRSACSSVTRIGTQRRCTECTADDCRGCKSDA
jgi:hypothetical protein